MELLVKKTDQNPKGILDIKAFKVMILSDLQKKLDEMNSKISNTSIEEYKDDILKIYKEAILNTNAPINIKNVPSIEKNSDIKRGTMYYNEKTDNVRIKLSKGWTNLK